MAKRQGFVSFGQLTRRETGVLLTCRPWPVPALPPRPRGASCPLSPAREVWAWGRGAALRPTVCPWASPSQARQVPPGTPRPRTSGSREGFARPRSPPSPPAPVARPFPSQTSEALSVKSCGQSRLTSSLECTGRTEAWGLLTGN